MTIPWAEVIGVIRKESGPAALAVAFVTGVYVFVPSVAAIGPPAWRPYGLAAFLAATSVALLRGIDGAVAKWKVKEKVSKERRRLLRLVRNLPPEAKGLVQLLMKQEALRLDVRDATVSLVHAMELTHRASVSYGGFWFDFTMQPDARRLLTESPEVLEGAAKPTVVLRQRRVEDDEF